MHRICYNPSKLLQETKPLQKVALTTKGQNVKGSQYSFRILSKQQLQFRERHKQRVVQKGKDRQLLQMVPNNTDRWYA